MAQERAISDQQHPGGPQPSGGRVFARQARGGNREGC